MTTPIEGKKIWNGASKAGLVLGGVSIAYLVITGLLSKASGSVGAALLISVGSILLWIAKFAGCILLMRFFMKKFASANEGVTNNTTFRFGVIAALCSSLLFAAFYLLYTAYLAPELTTQAIDSVLSNYSSMLSSADLESIENIEGSLPTIGFFANWIYCFLFGVILSAILSKNIPSSNPFAEDKKPQE